MSYELWNGSEWNVVHPDGDRSPSPCLISGKQTETWTTGERWNSLASIWILPQSPSRCCTTAESQQQPSLNATSELETRLVLHFNLSHLLELSTSYQSYFVHQWLRVGCAPDWTELLANQMQPWLWKCALVRFWNSAEPCLTPFDSCHSGNR